MKSLQDNVSKQQRMLIEIIRLTNDKIYYFSNPTHGKAMYDCDRANRKHLRKLLKKFKRINTVIIKQTCDTMSMGDQRKYYGRFVL